MTTDQNQAEQSTTSAGDEPGKPRSNIKIGTQRPGVAVPKLPPRTQTNFTTTDPDALPPAVPVRTASTPVVSAPANSNDTTSNGATPNDTAIESAQAETPSVVDSTLDTTLPAVTPAQPSPVEFRPKPAPMAKSNAKKRDGDDFVQSGPKVTPPNLRAALSDELERELAESLGDMSLEQVLAAEDKQTNVALEPEMKVKARVVRVHRDDVFVELPGMQQGVVNIKQFTEAPAEGTVLELMIGRYDADEGLYELTKLAGAVDVGDWSDISEGMIVEAKITGSNKGGLECEVNRLRGFIPAGQISLYRVENFEEFVGQKFNVVVTEANRDRRNLILSRRGVMEREQAAAKEQLMTELAEGQEREGIVRSVRDFGAFVDLGGVDGMLHVSQLSWGHVKHPSEVLTVGQKIKVKIQRIDPATGKIGLSYRDTFESPWATAATKYPITATVGGTVTKIMEFGAFVRLENGIEGLVHISELSHKRVFRVSDMLKEGQQVEAKVLSIDAEAQRMSLSMKALEARIEPVKKAGSQSAAEPEVEEAPLPPIAKHKGPLKGGIGRGKGGEQFGLRL